MWRSRAEQARRSLRWGAAALALAVAPKCLLCLAAYAGIGTFLGVKLAGPEFCGAPAGPTGEAKVWFAAIGAILGVLVLLSVPLRRKRPRPPRASPPTVRA